MFIGPDYMRSNVKSVSFVCVRPADVLDACAPRTLYILDNLSQPKRVALTRDASKVVTGE